MNRVSRLLAPRAAALVCALFGALALSACGGDSGDGTFSGEEVKSGFEEAAGGFPFEKTATLVEGKAVAYTPSKSLTPEEAAELEENLGEGSVLWQVVVFEGEEPPTGEEAAKEAAFASDKFEEVGDDTFMGDSDIAYIVNGNAVVNGPALDGDPEDETLVLWREALDDL